MRKLILMFTLVLLAFASVAFTNTPVNTHPTSQAADERIAVTAVAQSYMDAYYTADVRRMKQVLHPDFRKRTLQSTENGRVEVTQDTTRSVLEGVRSGSGKTIPATQRVQKIEVLDIYKNAASLKVVTGRWTDYMLLSKLNGEWRVLDVVLQYTQR